MRAQTSHKRAQMRAHDACEGVAWTGGPG